MFNAERLLGQLMGQAMGGQLGGRKKKKHRGGFGMPSGGQMAVGLGVLGVAMAAYEHYSQKSAAPAPQPMAGAGLGTAVPPPAPPGPAVPPPAPPAAADTALRTEQAMHLLRSMITAAHADGLMDPEERDAILDRAREAGLDPEELQMLDAEMRAPFTLDQLVVRTPVALRAETYAAALVAITADTDEERAFLDRLAGSLEIDQATRRDLHARLGLDA
ncbi:tellurite resistance TerB family protein [Arenimonas sp.]|uniref:tellurite resistance TerB family protein n=1 Tax=Arenimonas sp. TaxID=1872635 RepID=UPI0035B465D4